VLCALRVAETCVCSCARNSFAGGSLWGVYPPVSCKEWASDLECWGCGGAIFKSVQLVAGKEFADVRRVKKNEEIGGSG
jgi:hypothetical protein